MRNALLGKVFCAGVIATIFGSVFNTQANAGDFPGKGEHSAWTEAIPYYNLANKQLNEGRFQEAVANFEAAIALYKFDPDFHLNLGVALRKMDDYSGAESAFKTAAALSPDDWMCWSNLANAYLKQNKLKQTIAAFERTLKCNPPESERAAILKDITDIRKVLSMQPPEEQGGETSGFEQDNRPARQTVVPDFTPPAVAPQTTVSPVKRRASSGGGAGGAGNPFHRTAPGSPRAATSAAVEGTSEVAVPTSGSSASTNFEPSMDEILQAIPKSAKPRTASGARPAATTNAVPSKSTAKQVKSPTEAKTAPAPEQKQLLKDSGWDYIYK